MDRRKLQRLAEANRRSKSDLYRAVVQAVDSGVTKVDVSEATGLSRVTIDRILRNYDQEAGQ